MKITDIRVVSRGFARDFPLVEVDTDAGITGIGATSSWTRPVSALLDSVPELPGPEPPFRGLLLGADPARPAYTKMYWTDDDSDNIMRANLDGSQIDTLISGLEKPRSIALDLDAGNLYCTYSYGKIYRANLDDGSRIGTIGFQRVHDLALDVANGVMYVAGDDIYTTDLDGCRIETLAPYVWARSIALDLSRGKMYWKGGYMETTIQRANLDGSQIDTLVFGLTRPYDIAVDSDGGKLYWTDEAEFKIQRANLDGSEVETLISTGQDPRGIALDVDKGQMYWAEKGSERIMRSNLDGSQVTTLVSQYGGGIYYPLWDPTGIALGP